MKISAGLCERLILGPILYQCKRIFLELNSKEIESVSLYIQYHNGALADKHRYKDFHKLIVKMQKQRRKSQ